MVKSKQSDHHYEIDRDLYLQYRITGFPSGEPCKHQHAVANKYKLNSPNLIPCFNAMGKCE